MSWAEVCDDGTSNVRDTAGRHWQTGQLVVAGVRDQHVYSVTKAVDGDAHQRQDELARTAVEMASA